MSPDSRDLFRLRRGFAIQPEPLNSLTPNEFYFVQSFYRELAMFLLQSSSTCWAIAVNDYGTFISSVLALSTFVALFFLSYVLHRTLASRTPEGRQRQQQNAEKHKRKKRRQQGHHTRGSKQTGRHSVRTSPRRQKEEHEISVELDSDDIIQNQLHAHMSSIEHIQSLSLAPKAESLDMEVPVDERIASVVNETSQHHIYTTIPIIPTILESPTALHVKTTNNDSKSVYVTGRCTPIPATVVPETFDKPSNYSPNERCLSETESPSSVGTTYKESTVTTRRLQNNRRGKKLPNAGDIGSRNQNTQQQPSPPQPAPSKRWDALKPENRNSHGRQRIPTSAKTRAPRVDTTERFESAPKVHSAEAASEKEFLQIDDRSLNTHENSILNSPSIFSHGSVIRPFSGNTYSRSKTAVERPQSTSRTLEQDKSESTTFALNPNSLSWNSFGSRANVPMRPPPGLGASFQNDIPFGCGSSDDGNSAPHTPFRVPSFAQESFNTENKYVGVSDSTSLFYSDVFSARGHFQLNELSAPVNEDLSDVAPCRSETGDSTIVSPPPLRSKHRYLRENPFAICSDEEADVDQIEAELQELGGRMVGSVLDF